MRSARFPLLIILFLTIFGGKPAFAYLADEPHIPGQAQMESLIKNFNFDKRRNTFEAGLGYRMIDEDHFLTLDARLNLNLGPVGLGIQLPLNFRIWDNDPKTDKDYTALRVRHEDWDGGIEWMRLIRYVRLGHKGETFYLRWGELTGDIGHQTIVGHYDNNIDVNAFHTGLAFDLNLDYGGIELLFNDLLQMGSERANTRLFATRVHVNPFAFIDKHSFWKRFGVGFTVATDIGAPMELALNSDNTVATYDDKPRVISTANTTVIGWDLEFRAIDTELITVKPYFDMNFITQAGMGVHLGVLATVRLNILKGLRIPMRFEYRGFQSDYLPTYFDAYYDIERYQYGLSVRTPTTKRQYLALNKDQKGVNGLYGNIAIDLAGYVQIGMIYEDYKGAAANFSLFVNVPAWERAQFALYYSRVDIRGGEDFFGFDDRTLFLALAKVKIIPFLYVAAQYSRTWQLNELSGKYDAVNDFNIGVMTSISF